MYVNIDNVYFGVLLNIPIPLHNCVHLCVYTYIFNLYFSLYTAQSFERMSCRVPVVLPSPLPPLSSPYIPSYFAEAGLCLKRIDCLPGDLSQYTYLAPPENYTHKQNLFLSLLPISKVTLSRLDYALHVLIVFPETYPNTFTWLRPKTTPINKTPLLGE